MICLLEPNGKIVWITSTQTPRSARAFQHLIGRNIKDLAGDSDLATARSFVEETVNSGCKESVRMKLRIREDDRVEHFECSGVHTETGILCFLNRIDHYQEMQDAYKSAQTMLRLIFGTMPLGLIVARASGQIEGVSSAVEEMFGYSSEELRQQTVGLLVGDNNFAAVLNGAAGHVHTFTVKKKSGDELTIDVCVQYIDPATKQKMLICITDASERHKLEVMKQEFFAMVSHDLRTPLTSFMFFLDAMALGMYDASSEEAKERAADCQREISRVIKMINSLLQLESMESKITQVEPSLFPASQLIARTVQSISALAANKQVRLRVACCDSFVFADEDQLIQVLVNLAGNALKFSPPGEEVSIEADEVDEWLEFRVSDRGSGISESDQHKLFDRFKQLAAGKRRGGTGLGLAIAKGIVNAHGGTIGVISTEGVGSTFWFRIPNSESAPAVLSAMPEATR